MANFSVTLCFKITAYIQFDDSYDFSFYDGYRLIKKVEFNNSRISVSFAYTWSVRSSSRKGSKFVLFFNQSSNVKESQRT